MSNGNGQTKESKEHPITDAGNGPATVSEMNIEAQREFDAFIKERPDDAREYLRLLREEIDWTIRSQSRYTYFTWLLIAMFLILETNSGQTHFEFFEHIDESVLLKFFPPAIMASFYVIMSRWYLAYVRLEIHGKIAKRLFPGKYYPFSDYIYPAHLMTAERLLNRYRPIDEIFTNNIFLAVIIYVVLYSPAAVSFYAYYVILKLYGLHDWLVLMSICVGFVFFAQAYVMTKGRHVANREGFARLDKLRPKKSKHQIDEDEKP